MTGVGLKRCLLAATMAAGAVGSAQAAPACKMGVSMYTLNAPYFAAQEQAAVAEGKKLGCTVTTADGQNQMTKQIGDVEDMVAKGINLLIINPRDPEGLVPAVNAASAAGVKVIVMDSSLDPKANYVSLVQSSNTQNGMLVGEWLAKKMAGKPLKIALISGDKGNVVGEQRRLGVISGLVEGQLDHQGSTNFRIVAQGWGDWNNAGGLKAMEDILTAHPDVNVVIGENDSMVLGARTALKSSGKLKSVLLVAAADGQRQAIKLIKQGKYGATGMNNPVLVAHTAVKVGLKALNNKLPANFPKTDYTKPAVIDQADAGKYYNPKAVF